MWNVETPCKFIIAKLSIRKLGSSSVLTMRLKPIFHLANLFARIEKE